MFTITSLRGLLPALLLSLLLPSVGSGQTRPLSDSGSVIEASGSAQVTLPPDRAVIRFAVDSRAPTAAQAAAINSPRVRRVVAALSALRSPQESVLVTGIGVGPNENYDRGTIVDYRATAIVRLVVRNLDSLGRYLEVALSNGATQVADVSFHSEQADSARRDALSRAYAQALASAQAVAHAAHGVLGPLLRVSTDREYDFDYGALREEAAFSVSRQATVPLAARDVMVSATITAVWRFTPGQAGP
jgi:uncharacterized protein